MQIITDQEKLLILLKWSPDLTEWMLDDYYEDYLELKPENETFTNWIDRVMSPEYQILKQLEDQAEWNIIDQLMKDLE